MMIQRPVQALRMRRKMKRKIPIGPRILMDLAPLNFHQTSVFPSKRSPKSSIYFEKVQNYGKGSSRELVMSSRMAHWAYLSIPGRGGTDCFSASNDFAKSGKSIYYQKRAFSEMLCIAVYARVFLKILLPLLQASGSSGAPHRGETVYVPRRG